MLHRPQPFRSKAPAAPWRAVSVRALGVSLLAAAVPAASSLGAAAAVPAVRAASSSGAAGAALASTVPTAPTGRVRDIPLRGPAAGRQPSAPTSRRSALKITLLGDSITAGGDWQRRFPRVAITNAGRPGDTTLDVLARLEPIRAGRADVVLLMVGINDLLQGARVEAVAERIGLIRQLLSSGGRPRLIQQSTLACEASRCGPTMVARVRALNRLLRARVAAADYLDVESVLSDRTGLRPAYSLDGLHLNAAGYGRWQELLAQRLPQLLGPSPPNP